MQCVARWICRADDTVTRWICRPYDISVDMCSDCCSVLHDAYVVRTYLQDPFCGPYRYTESHTRHSVDVSCGMKIWHTMDMWSAYPECRNVVYDILCVTYPMYIYISRMSRQCHTRHSGYVYIHHVYNISRMSCMTLS